MNFTQLIIKRPTIVVVIFSVLALLGIVSYTNLNYDLLPKMNMPMLSITTQYPGASASEVENSVTKKLEDVLSSLENVKNMQSTSREGTSSIQIELESNANVDKALQDAQRKVNSVQSSLPSDVKTPTVNSFSSDEMPVIKCGITANMDQTKLYQLADEQIKSRLSRLDGVGQVSIIGGEEREIQINIQKNKIDAYKISISQITQAISRANQEFPTGKIDDNSRQYTIRLSGKIKTLDMLENIPVSQTSAGGLIKLSDLAKVIDTIKEPTTYNRINGVNSLGFIIQKQSDANTVNVCKLVKKEITAIEKTYETQGVKFNIASDNSVYTLASAKRVFEDLLTAVFLVSIVMFLFLHSIRNAFIVMISIPCSIISVFTAMYIFDFSLNMMTLLALALIIGILVDDSIVILENIHRHLKSGKDRKQATIDGRSEIGFTAIAITMVDIVVFLPLSLVGGMIGHMLKEFALVVVFSTLMSLFVSFTVTPLLASRFSRIENLTRKTLFGSIAIGFEGLFDKLKEFYESVLRWSLAHRRSVYVVVSILFIGSISLIPLGYIGAEFVASGDKGEFVIKIEGEPSNTLQQTKEITEKVEKILLKKPEVIKIYSNIGTSSSMKSSSLEQNKSELTVTIVPKQKRKQSVNEFAAMVKNEISNIPGIKVTSAATTLMGGSMESAIQLLLCGPVVDSLYEVADSVMSIIKSVPGTGDIKLSIEKNNPEIQIILDREKMSQLGLSVSDVGSTLQLAFAGNTNMQYSENGKDYDINVKFDKANRENVEDIGSLTFMNNKGNIIELQDFADIEQSMAPNQLERNDRMSSLTVQASASGRPLGTICAEIDREIKRKIHVDDISIQFKGDMEHQKEAFGGLFMAIAAALIFVYLIMVLLYNSYLYPFIVFFSIPVALIGALSSLALTHSNLSIFAIIGMIMLIGLVCKNAILIVDFTNQLREKGHTLIDALIEAGKVRLRPILMTTFSMVLGMLPIALASTEGAEVKNGMAWVIIGGLISSLLLTLILVPSVYMSMDKIKNKKVAQTSNITTVATVNA